MFKKKNTVKQNITDQHWNDFANEAPYFAVCTDPAYRNENLTPQNRERFFETGNAHIQQVIKILQVHFGAPGRFGLSMDFGCGVGRCLLPLARISDKAIGVDVAPPMLAECRSR